LTLFLINQSIKCLGEVGNMMLAIVEHLHSWRCNI